MSKEMKRLIILVVGILSVVSCRQADDLNENNLPENASVKIMKSHEFPYGPFLAGALFIVFFHLDKFTNLINFLFAI